MLAAAPECTTGMTALHYAAAGGAAAAVELLLRLAPAVVGAADSFGHWLPLHFAAGSGRLRALRLLLEADPAAAGAAGDSGDLPLHVAVSGGNEEAVQLLLAAHPAAAWTADRQGQLPLHIAAARPSVRIARLLLSAYPAAASMPDKMGRVPVYTAAESATGRPRMVQLLLAATPAAALLGSADAAAGAAAAATPPGCFTPLHEAARGGDYESVRLLLAAAPQAAGAVDGKGRLPLQLALERPGRRRGGVLRLLIAAAPEAAAAAVRKQQLIHWAAKKGAVKALELLLPLAPEQAEQPDDHGWLPIHYVARGSLRNCPAMARMLMAAAPGCAMAAEPERGSLPLHLAASGCLPLVQLLTAAAPQAVTTPDATGQVRSIALCATSWQAQEAQVAGLCMPRNAAVLWLHLLGTSYGWCPSAPPATSPPSLSPALAHAPISDQPTQQSHLSLMPLAPLPPCRSPCKSSPTRSSATGSATGIGSTWRRSWRQRPPQQPWLLTARDSTLRTGRWCGVRRTCCTWCFARRPPWPASRTRAAGCLCTWPRCKARWRPPAPCWRCCPRPPAFQTTTAARRWWVRRAGCWDLFF